MDERAMNQNHYDDEIDLTRVFSALWKRKWLFTATVLITVCLGIILAFSLPDIYRAYVVLQPGILDVTPDGKYIYLDSVQNIKAKIDSNAYSQRLYESLEEGVRESRMDFKADIPKNANVLVVSAEAEKERIEQKIKNIYLLIKELEYDYSTQIERRKLEIAKQKMILENELRDIEVKKKGIDNQIALAKNEMKAFKSQIDSYRHTLAVLEAREKELLNEILMAQRNSERLIQGRESFIQQHFDNKDPHLADILYTTTIQQNVSFSNELQSRLSELRMKKEDITGLIIRAEKLLAEKKVNIEQLELQKNEQLEVQIARKNIDIQDLEKRNSYIQNMQMVSKPIATKKPVKPNRKMIIVLSAMVGCFLGFAVALIKEYVSFGAIGEQPIKGEQ